MKNDYLKFNDINKLGWYVYTWWSGMCIEQEHCPISKIDKSTVYFWNDYCKENQERVIKNLRKIDIGYLCEHIE